MNNFEEHIQKEEQIAHHEVESGNRNQNQIRLATELFEHLFNTKIDFTNSKEKFDVMTYWYDKGYSQAYEELENSEEFKNHPDTQGDIRKITIQHVINFLEKGTL